MDFVKHLLPGRDDLFFLRFSKISTVVWAVVLIVVAYLSRRVDFVLNAAFSLRGLTSGALLGGLALAVFWKNRQALPVVVGMLASLVVMTAIQVLPANASTKPTWMNVVGTEIYWPWYTLIGVCVTLGVAWLVARLVPVTPSASIGDGSLTPPR